MQNKLNSFFSRYEFLIPFFIFILFLAASLPGVSWGAPALWNPDELIWRVDQALAGNMKFDVTEPDFNYPSLPKYVMYAIGSVTYGIGRSTYAFIVAARTFSGVLGALVGVLVYLNARAIGANKRISALAGVLYIVSGVAVANARFAHNDLYLQFFCALCLYCVTRFQYSQLKTWLYASFLAVGMAASSKYTGASMVLLPIGVFLFMNWKNVRYWFLHFLGVLILGGVLVVLGYGIGTPRLFLAPATYLSKAIPAAIRFSQYGFNSGTPVGLYGQWGVFKDAVGIFAYYLFLMAFMWFVIRLLLNRLGKVQMSETMTPGLVILVANVILFDLPFLISINYIPRHFIPFVPLFAILAAFFVDEILRLASDRKLVFVQPAVATLMILGIAYSLLRLASIALLFMNDARIPAGEYIAEIRGYGKGIEYTLYPPNIEKRRFTRAHNYPIYFVKYAGEVVPTGGRFEFNQGEQGLLDRSTDYFVIDSYTYDRFYVESICETNPVECDFFKRLLAGEVESYRLVADFSYRLPTYLPQVSVAPVNPDVQIYERVP
ncbi:MAG: phospholipid carrier-dependent glycosyltransferase [Chloroflexi bacterium]|nr:phospholipid carrier-dependent glycosyltransferase [Chloroflexota bacterium]